MDKQTHTYKRYDKELAKLEKQVYNMGNHVTSQLDLLLDQLCSAEQPDYDELIENDVVINGLEVKANKTVIRLLARRAPMGRDLRFIIASSRMVTDLERIGDEVVSMAKSLAHLDSRDLETRRAIYRDVEGLIATVMNLLDRTLLAARNEDEKTARSIISEHVKKGGPFHQKTKQVIAAIKQNFDSVEQSFDMAMEVNALKRISDHICNICEHIIFLVTGEDIRHQDD